MKKYKFIIFILFELICFNRLTIGQGTDVKEWTRKRHNIEGGHYGHPYTIFDRHDGLQIS